MSNLIKYHSTACNPMYASLHFEIAGLLQREQLKTFAAYKYECDLRGIIHYNEECFNKYLISRGLLTEHPIFKPLIPEVDMEPGITDIDTGIL